MNKADQAVMQAHREDLAQEREDLRAEQAEERRRLWAQSHGNDSGYDPQPEAEQTAAAETMSKIRELERAIARIERDYSNVIGGSAAYHSGKQTHLKPAAQKKLDKLNRELDQLLDQCEA